MARFQKLRSRVKRSYSGFRNAYKQRGGGFRKRRTRRYTKKSSLLKKVLIAGGVLFAAVKWGLPAFKSWQAKNKKPHI